MSLNNEAVSYAVIARIILLQNRQNKWKISISGKGDMLVL
jgi:hypothetical protein